MNTITTMRGFEAIYLTNDGKIDAKEAKQLIKLAGDDKGNQAALKEMFARDSFDSGVKPNKLLAGAGIKGKVTTSPIAGTKVGNTTVLRSFGEPAGYSNKFQAIGVARMQGMSPLAVVKDANGKWHAVETKEKLTSTDIKKGFPLNDVDPDAHAAALKMPSGTAAEKIAQAKALAKAALGVPDELINVVEGKTNFNPEQINVDVNDKTASGRTHVHGSDCGCAKNGSALELMVGRLKTRPESSAATLFHEGQHKADLDVVDGTIGKKHLTTNEKLSKDTLTSAKGHSEASANGHAFVVAIDKDKTAALNQLIGCLEAGPQGDLRSGLVKEMKAHFATLPADKQKDFKEVVATAELYWPNAGLWKDLFGSEKKPDVKKGTIPLE